MKAKLIYDNRNQNSVCLWDWGLTKMGTGEVTDGNGLNIIWVV